MAPPHVFATFTRWRRLVVLVSTVVLLAAGCSSSTETKPDHPPEQTPAELSDSDIIPVADSPIRGAEHAWVTVVVFADFQCPFCARLAATLDEVRQIYEESTVRLVFKHHPLEHHQGADPAARAAEAARNQGKFWQMHDALFDDLAGLNSSAPEDAILRAAQRLGLDKQQLREDMNSDEITARIHRDLELADELNLDGVPAVFVNGGYIPGARTADVYHSAIQNVLEVLRQGVTEGEIDRRDIYRSSVETLYEHTNPAESNEQPAPNSIVEIPVDDQPETARFDDALVQIGLFVDLGADSSLQLLRRLTDMVDPGEVRIAFFHLPDPDDEPTRLAHRALEGATSHQQVRQLVDWLADTSHDWRTDPSRLKDFARQIDIEFADDDQLDRVLEEDLEAAKTHRIYGTPTFFINGIRLAGVPDEEALYEVLEEQLALAVRVSEVLDLEGRQLYEELIEGNRQRSEDGLL